MKVKRYTAENIRKALQLVKEDLGEEAIILSNRIVGDMVEVIATEDPPVKRFDSTILQSTKSHSESRLIEKDSIDALAARLEFFQNIIEGYTKLFDFKIKYQSPYVFYLFNFLYQYGFNDTYAKFIVQKLHQKNINKKEMFDNFLVSVKNSISFSANDPLGSYLFIGPSGSGKTSVIAKLATSYRLIHPDSIISFIYLDLDKSGGERNLAQYAKILNTKFSYVDNLDVFKQVMMSSQSHDLILIDTNFSFQFEQYQKVCKILDSWTFITLGVVPTTHDNQVINQYFKKIAIDEIIITKTDESSKIGVGLSLAYDLNKPISYISTGVQLANQLPKAHMNVIEKIIFEKELSLTQAAIEPLALDEPIIWKMSGAIS